MRFGLIFLLLLLSSSNTASAAGNTLKIVTFGTSLTERGGWQEPLRAALEKCLAHPVEVEIVARSGSTSDWAVIATNKVIAEEPDIILVEFYANDAALNRYMTVGRSRANMETVLEALKVSLPKTRVIMMVMNPMFGMRGMIRPFLGSYISAHLEVAKREGVEIIDHTTAWSSLSDRQIAEAIPDGIHPISAAVSAVIVPGIVRTIAPECKP